MFFLPLLELLALSTLATLVQAGTTISCGSPRGLAVCARYIRPYSENAYSWQNVCYITNQASTSLIADNLEQYDFRDGCDSPLYTATCCAGYGGCGLAYDCDVETAPPVPQTDPELPNDWEIAVRCAVDNAARVLANPIVSYMPSNDPYTCASLCISKGYQWAGVEYGDECYCGTGYAGGVVPPIADASDCSMLCSGSYYFNCGGSWRMQIYKAPNA